VTDFLVGHEVDQRDVVGSKTGCGELLHGELGDTVVEQVKLDPFLVQRQVQRLEVDYARVRLNSATGGSDIRTVRKGRVDRRCVVGPDTLSTLGDGCWHSRNEREEANNGEESFEGDHFIEKIRRSWVTESQKIPDL